jgi:hypothetical protein
VRSTGAAAAARDGFVVWCHRCSNAHRWRSARATPSSHRRLQWGSWSGGRFFWSVPLVFCRLPEPLRRTVSSSRLIGENVKNLADSTA